MTLVELIKNDTLIENNTKVLENFVTEYPYCQTAHLLLLLSYKKNKSLSYNKQLRITSAYTLDRNSLFRIINNENSLLMSDIEKEEEKIIEKILPIEENAETILPKDVIESSENKSQAIDSKDIIEHFIINEPRIRINKDIDSENDLSENSVQDKFDLVSETLAQIYVKQGNLEKAIKTFEKLCLKYPEKNSYFAAQIENLKNQLNN